PTGASYVSGTVHHWMHYDPHRYPGTNLLMYGFEPGLPAEFVSYSGGPIDPHCPRLNTAFSDDRLPLMDSAYYLRDWDTGLRLDQHGWPGSAVAFRTSPGQVLELPDSGYDIGGGFDAIILYASDEQIAIHYGREDNPVTGYTLYFAGVCPDPALRSLYERNHAAGRRELPTIRGNTPVGRAIGRRVFFAIRDTGAFMDVRSREWYDW
ncbi:MAG: hypothetical protein N2515_11250, partial [Deltaproteobacteria bacterium]|nr:hypothetical protein [Deltaproteobacteria bacterium]